MLKAISNLAPLVMIAAIVMLAATGRLLSSSALVIVAQALAVGLAVWARRSFSAGAFRVTAAPGGDALIQQGPYRLIRHPMYAAALLFLWAAVLAHFTIWTGAVAVVVTAVVTLRIILEERLLRERYAEYATYARSTKALVPYLL